VVGKDNYHADFLDSWTCPFCCRVGELFENAGRYKTAIAWYQRCCWYSGGGKRGVLAQSGDLCNLGLAQKRAALWEDALGSYARPVATFCRQLSVHVPRYILARR
jgi:hypothetical protein